MVEAAHSNEHYPVMLPEVLAALNPKDGGVYVDGTFGAGGYTRAILESADCTVIAIDRDLSVMKHLQPLKDKYGERLVFVHGRFGDVKKLLSGSGFTKVDGFVMDLGISSMQIDQADRGFSFRFDGPLDMRMDSEADIPTAADLVNTAGEAELADIIYKYGEERHSRRVAKRIVQRRAEKKFETTQELADLVRAVVHKSPKDKTDQATRTFQALRIAVNNELGELESALASSPDILNAGGRLVVVTFHSLEDSIVKRFIREKSGRTKSVSRHMPVQSVDEQRDILFLAVYNKAVKPSEKEVSENPRSRSAKLRAAERTSVGSSAKGES